MEQNYSHVNPWNGSESQETLRQVADLCVQALNLPLQVTPDSLAFYSEGGDGGSRQGILSYHGRLVGNDFIVLECELFQGPPDLRVSSKAMFEHLSTAGDKVKLAPPQGTPFRGSILFRQPEDQGRPPVSDPGQRFFERVKASRSPGPKPPGRGAGGAE